MSRLLAVISNGLVANVIVGEATDYPDAIDVTDLSPRPAPGWTFDGDEFAPPADPPAPFYGTRVTKLAFCQRLTDPVLVAIEIASIHNPAASPAQQQLAAQLRVMQANVQVATFIDLARQDTRAGVQALEAAGLLPVGGAATVLDAPVQAHEVPDR